MLNFNTQQSRAVLISQIGGRFYDSSFTQPSHGTLVLGEIGRGGGPLYYVPDEGFLGQDDFTLTNQFIFDPPVSPKDVRVQVFPGRPGAPVGVDDGEFTVELGQTLTIGSDALLANDMGDGLSILGISGSSALAFGEFYEFGNIVVYAGADQPGIAEFNYLLVDADGQVDLARFTVQVVNPAVFGTEGPDILNGSVDPDRIEALGGDDLVDGGAGADSILGGDGADTLRGGAGLDRLDGNAGDDALDGGAGFDRLDGGPGADRLRGGASKDSFILRRGEIADPALHGGKFDHITDFALDDGVAGSGDNLRLEGFSEAATLAYLRDLGGRSTLHLYQVTDGDYAASFILQIAGSGAERLAANQFSFG